MKVMGYTRVSTEGQVEHGVSLAVQRAKIEAYGALHELPLGEVIEDAGYSAKRLARPGMARLLRSVDAGDCRAVIVCKLDRLSRSTRDVLELIERFERRGVALHSIEEHLDTQSAVGRFVLRTLASLAEMERDLIGERTKEAMAHLRDTGQVYCRPRFVDCEVLAWLRAQRLAGRSYGAMAAELQVKGIPTARGGGWHATTVRQLLSRAA
jgi:site-specific DNA recombinase